MKTGIRAAFVTLTMAGVLGWVEAPLQAQVQAPTDLSAAINRSPREPWSRLVRRQPQVDEALRGFGFRADRLDRQQERALDATFQELFPDRDPRRDRLNRTQANALIYMALVHSSRRNEGRPGPRRMFCETSASKVYGLEGLFTAPGRGQPQLLRRDEQERLSVEAQEIARLVRGCGDNDLIDNVDAFVSLLEERRVERERVARHVNRMKTLARVAGGR